MLSYCLKCGTKGVYKIPEGDTRLRLVCPNCRYIHYENPKVITGAVLVHAGKVLLCRRAIEPRKGFWTLPAGFMELGETIAQGATRETYEESAAISVNTRLYGVYDLLDAGQVYTMHLGRVQNGHFGCGSESLECALVDPHDVPWDELAFEVIRETLRTFIAHQAQFGDDLARYPLHQFTLPKPSA